jgi:hypothetical protein
MKIRPDFCNTEIAFVVELNDDNRISMCLRILNANSVRCCASPSMLTCTGTGILRATSTSCTFSSWPSCLVCCRFLFLRWSFDRCILCYTQGYPVGFALERFLPFVLEEGKSCCGRRCCIGREGLMDWEPVKEGLGCHVYTESEVGVLNGSYLRLERANPIRQQCTN